MNTQYNLFEKEYSEIDSFLARVVKEGETTFTCVEQDKFKVIEYFHKNGGSSNPNHHACFRIWAMNGWMKHGYQLYSIDENWPPKNLIVLVDDKEVDLGRGGEPHLWYLRKVHSP